METHRSLAAAASALALLGGAPAGACAQGEPPVDFDVRGGVGLAAGSLSDVVRSPGPAFAVGFGVGITDRFFLRAEGGAELHEGIDVSGASGAEGVNDLEVHLIHFQAGGLYDLRPRDENRLFVTLDATAGVTNLEVPRLQTSVGAGAVEVDLSELYLSTSGGAAVGLRVGPRVDLFLDGRVRAVFGDEADTAELVRIVDAVADEPVDGLGTLVSVPVTAGVRFHF